MFFCSLLFSSFQVIILDKCSVYRITIKGVVSESWVDRLGGMRITASDAAQTTLEGWLPDQAALKGVLDTLYGLHIPLQELKNISCP